MFSKEIRKRALEIYSTTGSVSQTIQQMGNRFSRQTLYQWIRKKDSLALPRKKKVIINSESHRAIPSAEFKLKIIKRCFEKGEMVKDVAKEIGYGRQTIYYWHKEYMNKGLAGLMRDAKVIRRGPLNPSNGSNSESKEIEYLQDEIRKLKMQIEILQEGMKIIKKELGINAANLSNREKKRIVDALSEKYELKELLVFVGLARSSYYYQLHVCEKNKKHFEEAEKIEKIFKDNYCCYGYRRIYRELKQQGIRLSEKIIRRIMRQRNLVAAGIKKARYSSYRGEISEAPDNIIGRNFKAEYPNQKWLTDITEFAIPSGKAYLSVVIDCFDGCPISWEIGNRPNAQLANNSLSQAIKGDAQDYKGVILHSDRGCHYRWPGWISLTKKYGIIRSMSAKGCSPDNAGCESFFGHLKRECFYGRNFENFSLENFSKYIESYLVWYSQKRIKSTLNYLSPKQYRLNLGRQ